MGQANRRLRALYSKGPQPQSVPVELCVYRRQLQSCCRGAGDPEDDRSRDCTHEAGDGRTELEGEPIPLMWLHPVGPESRGLPKPPLLA